MTVVRNGTDDDTVYAACANTGEIAYITDDSASDAVSGTIDVGVNDAYVLATRTDATARASTEDDTIFTLNYDDSSIGVVPAGVTSGGPYDDSVYFGGAGMEAWALAVSADDTAFATFDDTDVFTGDDTMAVVPPGVTSGVLDDSFSVAGETFGLVTFDDTLYSFAIDPGLTDRGVAALNMVTRTVDDSVYVSASPEGAYATTLVVSDDTLFLLATVLSSDDTQIAAINPRTLAIDDTVALTTNAYGMASEPSGMIITTTTDGEVEIINGATMTAVGDLALPAATLPEVYASQAITRSGVAYVGDWWNDLIYRIARVTPELDKSSGAASTAVVLSLTPDAADITVDDTTVVSVEFGGSTVPASSMTRTGNSFAFSVPSGSGTVAVTVNLNGGNAVSLGSWVYPADPPPPPAPAVPPSAPLDAAATAGDGSATVTWKAPTTSGSFAITQYQVASNPLGAGCLVAAPALTCEVTGLANGTEYTFEVRALSGAGWGPYSTRSNAVTPVGPEPTEPTITITGTRGDVRGKSGVIVSGATTGFEMGAILRPWFRVPGQSGYSEGAAEILVDASGEFTWQRRTGKKMYIVVRSEDGAIKSNRIVVAAR